MDENLLWLSPVFASAGMAAPHTGALTYGPSCSSISFDLHPFSQVVCLQDGKASWLDSRACHSADWSVGALQWFSTSHASSLVFLLFLGEQKNLEMPLDHQPLCDMVQAD